MMDNGAHGRAVAANGNGFPRMPGNDFFQRGDIPCLHLAHAFAVGEAVVEVRPLHAGKGVEIVYTFTPNEVQRFLTEKVLERKEKCY